MSGQFAVLRAFLDGFADQVLVMRVVDQIGDRSFLNRVIGSLSLLSRDTLLKAFLTRASRILRVQLPSSVRDVFDLVGD